MFYKVYIKVYYDGSKSCRAYRFNTRHIDPRLARIHPRKNMEGHRKGHTQLKIYSVSAEHPNIKAIPLIPTTSLRVSNNYCQFIEEKIDAPKD